MHYVVIAVLSVVALFGLLVLFIVFLKSTGLDQVRLTAEEVADTIERFIESRDGQWDWDDFTSVQIKDPELEAVRLRCVGLPDEFPGTYGEYCGEQGVTIMRELVAQLRASQAAQPTAPETNDGHPGATQ